MTHIVRRQPGNTGSADALAGGLSPLLQRVYACRGVCSAAELDLGLKSLLPFEQLKDIDPAAELLASAIAGQRHILVVGDYDADGATATALAMLGLGSLGAQRLSYLIPDRFKHGYGLTPAIVELALAHKPDLLITVDNGIASVAGVAAANAAGMAVLITDHHLPGSELPAAAAIVNPNQPGCRFPSKNLAGVGVMFYVLAALRACLVRRGQLDAASGPALADFLDLVALGTVADLVPLDHNNRVLVRQGLRRMQAGRTRPGIRALAQVAGRTLSRVQGSDIGFALAPRLNAAGRMENMATGVECLLASSEEQAMAAAAQLEQLNRDRRARQSHMQAQADEQLSGLENRASHELPLGLCLFEPAWHEGIVGLVAGKLKERHHRPSMAFAPSAERGLLKGSARSIPGVHIRDVLAAIATRHDGLIERFGGHAMAAGLTLPTDRFEEFRQAFEQELSRWLTPADLDQVLESDGELQASELTVETARLLQEAGPWGQGFPEPMFDGLFEVIDQRIVGEAHLKLQLCPAQGGAVIDAIAFRREVLLPPRVPLHFAYRPQLNEYRGRQSLQLIIEHVEQPESLT